jgi:hypothetical protein
VLGLGDRGELGFRCRACSGRIDYSLSGSRREKREEERGTENWKLEDRTEATCSCEVRLVKVMGHVSISPIWGVPMVCPKCSKEIPSESKFCCHCGTAVADSSGKSADQNMSTKCVGDLLFALSQGLGEEVRTRCARDVTVVA